LSVDLGRVAVWRVVVNWHLSRAQRLDFVQGIEYHRGIMNALTSYSQNQVWYYAYFTPPALLVGRMALSL